MNKLACSHDSTTVKRRVVLILCCQISRSWLHWSLHFVSRPAHSCYPRSSWSVLIIQQLSNYKMASGVTPVRKKVL